MSFDLSTLFSFLSLRPPHGAWYYTGLLLSLLGLAALIDARRGRVPDSLVLPALAAAILLSAFYEGWLLAGVRMATAAAAFFVLKSLNGAYFMLTNRDAFGMGDAKWTAAAVAGFGLESAFWAWVFGAWLGLAWFALRFVIGFLFPRLAARGYVHFVPFLFIGLLLERYAPQAVTWLGL